MGTIKKSPNFIRTWASGSNYNQENRGPLLLWKNYAKKSTLKHCCLSCRAGNFGLERNLVHYYSDEPFWKVSRIFHFKNKCGKPMVIVCRFEILWFVGSSSIQPQLQLFRPFQLHTYKIMPSQQQVGVFSFMFLV